MAVHSTPLATTVQLVPEQESWEGEGLLWRVQPICREAGARVTTNDFVRDLDMGVPNALDGRRLEVVADGLPLHGGAQLAIDTTMVSPLHADGTPHRLAATIDGAVCVDARRRKERTYPELLAPRSRAKLVVLALEVGGRWSAESLAFIRLLARAKGRGQTRIMRKRVEQAWRLRWLSLLGCAAAPCWNCAAQLVLRAPLLFPTKWKGTSGVLGLRGDPD